MGRSDKNQSNILGMFSGNPKQIIKLSMNIVIVAAVSLVFIRFIGIPAFSGIFQTLSPWNEQKKAISEYTDVRDTYSSIIGSEVGVIPQNGIVKWFSTREKEVIIYIPKIINYSPLFDDDSRRNELKGAFLESINEEMAKKSSETVRILYDGLEVATYKNGVKITDYLDLKSAEKKQIDSFVKEQVDKNDNIKFNKWTTTNNYSFDNKDKNVLVIKGKFNVKKFLVFKDVYLLDAKLVYKNHRWAIYQNNWKVTKVK